VILYSRLRPGFQSVLYRVSPTELIEILGEAYDRVSPTELIEILGEAYNRVSPTELIEILGEAYDRVSRTRPGFQSVLFAILDRRLRPGFQ
jgi:hypothetical protein